jgi:hypothetical protein
MPEVAVVAELSEEERRLVAERHPEIREDRPAMVVSVEHSRFFKAAFEEASRQVRVLTDVTAEARVAALGMADLSRQVAGAVEALLRQEVDFERVIEALTPVRDVPSAAAVLQARRNAEARAALAKEFGLLSSAEVADLAGSQAKNRAALANRWKKEERIFAVSHGGSTLWPGFQFDEDGKPLPVIAEVLAPLSDRGSTWQTALWFTSVNGWLGGRRPVDLLETEPDAVVEAARREADDLVF